MLLLLLLLIMLRLLLLVVVLLLLRLLLERGVCFSKHFRQNTYFAEPINPQCHAAAALNIMLLEKTIDPTG
jgi:hypothetical protein